ncbi:MAG: hypothetical protein C3F06_10800 [Candidatus Methanoperedenaceae archaeon]|nr:MAG: hypothetical protein C3F06_10800 [Candidatus Methanoperedenaceae archaeon]
MNKKYILGLVLIVGLLALPGVSAQGHPGGTMPAPTSNTGVNGCNTCHAITTFCKTCHAFPTFTTEVVANPTTVTAGTPTPVTFTVYGSNNIVGRKAVLSGSTVTLTGVASGIGTTSSDGTTAISVNASSQGAITATATATGFNSGTTTVTANAAQTTGSASVTFVVTDKVTGKPVHDAKVSMDGVNKETNDNGIAIFTKVSLKTHYYKVYEEHHAKFKGSIKVTGNMQVPVKLVPLVHKEERRGH